jgi:PST family polysaccharide transporter
MDEPLNATAPTISRTATSESSLTHRTAQGFGWFVGQMIAIKAVNLVGQVALAWLLGNADYGFAGLAFTVASFAGVVQSAGIRELIVRRGSHFARWAGAAFWLSLLMGASSAVMMLLAAPLAATFYRDQRLIGLIAVLSCDSFAKCLSAIPEAKLQIGLRFRMLATIGLVTAITTVCFSILFAAMGFGPYSYVLPLPVASLVRAILLWAIAGGPVRWAPRFRRWRYMLGHSGMLMLSTFFVSVTWQGDYIILGRLYSKEAVGVYFWAFILSAQTMQLLSANLAGVLFPSLARLQDDPARQISAFLRAAKALTVVAVPLTFVQAAAAGPVVRLLFDRKWHPGIGLIQILSLGFVPMVLFHPVLSMLKAQGRFRTLLLLTGAGAILFLCSVYAGAKIGFLTGTATGVATYAWIVGPIGVYAIIRTGGDGVRAVMAVFAGPVLAGALTVGAAMFVASFVPDGRVGDCIRTLLILGLGLGLYFVAIRHVSAETWKELNERARGLASRGRTTVVSSTPPADAASG